MTNWLLPNGYWGSVVGVSIAALIFFVPMTHGKLKKLNSTQLRHVQGQAGLNLQIDLNATADFLEFTDADGSFTGPGAGNAGALRLGNLSLSNGSSGSFTTLTIDADGSNGLVFEVPSSDAGFDVTVEQFTMPDDPASNSLNTSSDAGLIEMGSLDVTGSLLELTGTGDGVELNGEIDAGANYLQYDDADGGDAQFLIENPRISDFGFGNSSYDFSSLSVDIDQNGIAITPPSESFSLDASGICIEDFGSSSCSDEDYIVSDPEIDDLGFDGSSFIVRGTGNGLEVDGELRFTIDDIILDDDGTPHNTSDGTVNFETIRFTDASSGVGESGGGNAVPFDFDEPTLEVDGSAGLFFELPGFDTSGGTFDSPQNELYIQNINVGGSCFSGCGDWSVRNIDLGGSWVNISGRN